MNPKRNKSDTGNSLRNFAKSNRAIIIIVSIFMLVSIIYSFSGYRIPILDEGVYVGMGKNLFSDGANGFWERFRPIGMPLITGIMWNLGLEPYEASRIISIIMASASIIFVYLIAKKVFDKRIAILASMLFAITPIFFYYSDYVLTEIPSMLFILIGIYCVMCDRYFLAGIFCGAGFLFKFPQGIFLIIIGIFLLIMFVKNISDKDKDTAEKRYQSSDRINKSARSARQKNNPWSFWNVVKKGILVLIGFMIAISPYIMFNYDRYHEYTSSIYDATIEPVVSATIFQDNQYQNLQVNTLWQHIYGWLYYLVNLFANKTFVCLIYIFFFLGVYLFFKKRLYARDGHWHILLMVSFAMYLIYFTSIPYKQERFVYFLVPVAAIYSVYAILELYNWLGNIHARKKRRQAIISLTIIVALFTLITISLDASFFTWRYYSRPAVVTEYYEYFRDNNIQGTVATGDIILAIYADNKLTNMYELRADLEGENYRNISAIFHADYTYPCLDDACIADRNKFYSEINASYTLVKSGPCYSGNCYIYVKKANSI